LYLSEYKSGRIVTTSGKIIKDYFVNEFSRDGRDAEGKLAEPGIFCLFINAGSMSDKRKIIFLH